MKTEGSSRCAATPFSASSKSLSSGSEKRVTGHILFFYPRHKAICHLPDTYAPFFIARGTQKKK
jgi:hypothetical protein